MRVVLVGNAKDVWERQFAGHDPQIDDLLVDVWSVMDRIRSETDPPGATGSSHCYLVISHHDAGAACALIVVTVEEVDLIYVHDIWIA